MHREAAAEPRGAAPTRSPRDLHEMGVLGAIPKQAAGGARAPDLGNAPEQLHRFQSRPESIGIAGNPIPLRSYGVTCPSPGPGGDRVAGENEKV